MSLFNLITRSQPLITLLLLLFGVGLKLVNNVHQICDRVQLLVLFLLFKDKFCPEIKVLFDQDSCLIFIL